MSEMATELQAAIATARAGNHAQARSSFIRVLKQEPRNETAWFWLSRVMPSTEEALRCIDHLLTLNPRHAQAREAKDVLGIRLMLEELAVLKTQPATAYFRMSGTSMAAPVVSGAVALLLQDEPNLTPDQVKHRLMATAVKDSAQWPGYNVHAAGAGYLNIPGAVNGTTTESANTGVAASKLLWSGSESVNWNSVNWNSVNWNSVNWNSVNWNSTYWGT